MRFIVLCCVCRQRCVYAALKIIQGKIMSDEQKNSSKKKKIIISVVAPAVVFGHGLACGPVVVLCRSEHERSGDIPVAETCADYITAGFGVEFGGGAEIGRGGEVGGELTRHKFLEGLRHGLTHREGHHERIERRKGRERGRDAVGGRRNSGGD